MKINMNSPIRQTGAALIVALILLVTLSVMAISSMNSASLDLIMAGNEQYHARAFSVAEAGIEQSIAANNFNNLADPPPVGPTLIDSASTANNNDKYSYSSTRPIGSGESPPPPGYSQQNGSFSVYHFRIQSTGTSERGSISVNTQEFFEPTFGGGPPLCPTPPCGAL